jgi:hypothetical protein
MPRLPINYDNVYFYKIVCKDLNIAECYVGHTTHFINRKNKHKNVCIDVNNNHHEYPIYKFIRDNGGWDNWDMILIEQCTCESALDARKRERGYMEHLKATLNVRVPSRSGKEWRDDNKDKYQEYRKEYYEQHKDELRVKEKIYRENNYDKIKQRREDNKERDYKVHKVYHEKNRDKINENKKKYYESNKDKISEHGSQRITCACGAEIARGGKAQHERSIKHQQFIKTDTLD